MFRKLDLLHKWVIQQVTLDVFHGLGLQYGT